MDTGEAIARYFLKFIIWIVKYLLTFTGLIIPLTIYFFDGFDDSIDLSFIIYILSFILAFYVFIKNLYNFFKFK